MLSAEIIPVYTPWTIQSQKQGKSQKHSSLIGAISVDDEGDILSHFNEDEVNEILPKRAAEKNKAIFNSLSAK